MLFFKVFKRLYYALLTVIFLLVIGVVGYMFIEGFSFLEACYMTVITVSTVGFAEIHELSDLGRVFTIFLIVSSISAFAYAVTLLTSEIAEGNFTRHMLKYNLKNQLDNMKNHVIICGYGRVGKGAIEDLKVNGIPYVVIDSNDSFETQFRDEDVLFIHGDAAVEKTLIEAGIERAQALITCLPGDPENLYVVLSARQLNSSICIISRASRHDAVPKLKFAGATNVIMPDTVGGNHMASLVTNPDLMEFLDVIRYEANQGINVKSLLVKEFLQGFIGRQIADIESEMLAHCKIIGVKTSGGEYVVNPNNQLYIEEETRLFLLGNQQQIMELEQMLKE